MIVDPYEVERNPDKIFSAARLLTIARPDTFNAELHHLLYCASALSLQRLGRPLVHYRFVAGIFGPHNTGLDVLRLFARTDFRKFDVEDLDEAERRILLDTLARHGSKSLKQLSDLTMGSSPYRKAAEPYEKYLLPRYIAWSDLAEWSSE